MAKILLVEDDKSLREIYGVRLMAEGYEITSAGDGEEALAVAIKERPDLIVSDVMMPKISGFDMLDILRSTTETKDIKVIMMTALSSEDQRARGEALGADRYLVKSQVGIEDVVRTVHDVLGDGVAGTSPAAPAPAPMQAVAPAPVSMPEPTPVSPAPVPTAPADVEAVTAPVPDFVATPVTIPAPQPVAATPTSFSIPVTSTPVAPAPTPVVAPQPVATPVTPAPLVAAPVFQAPVAPITPVTPTPVATPTPQAAVLPEPTAPFSSNPPASLGDRIINPLPSADGLSQPVADIAAQMNQELNAQLQAAPAPTPPTPPLPPQPGV